MSYLCTSETLQSTFQTASCKTHRIQQGVKEVQNEETCPRSQNMQVTQEQTPAETETAQCPYMMTYCMISWALNSFMSRIILKAGNSAACLPGQAFKPYRN